MTEFKESRSAPGEEDVGHRSAGDLGQAGRFQSASEQTDMKAALDQLIDRDAELAHYARVPIAVPGNPD
ncbi:hypothetical protein NKJ52_10220 [Mesorhizobium australicum]|uniref:hypothetical protein n=1 Tax=Mesorhizobium australicum TaxID=536018 RepID=UPI003336507D